MLSYRVSFLVLALVFTFSGCKKQPSSINLEQIDNPAGHKIIAPGLGSIGFIDQQQMHVYYLNESHRWVPDRVSQFDIPDKNKGLLALGMGIIGLVQNQEMNFFYLDAKHEWVKDADVILELPRRYNRISTMRIPWQVGFVAIEAPKGIVNFHYLNEDGIWQKDETAAFIIPEQTDDYIMLGNMQIGIIKDNKLGVYKLDDQGEWHFLENTVLVLPENTEAVLAFEPETIAVLRNDMLRFFEIDMNTGQWYEDKTMDLPIPAF